MPFKKYLFLIALMTFSYIANAQNSNMTLFSENGERFSVILNGILQNASPETNVQITGLPAPSYKVKIIFENQEIPDLDKTIYFQGSGVEATYRLIQNRKGKYVLRFFNEVPLAQAPIRRPEERTYIYTTTPAVATSVTQTTSTTFTGVQPTGDHVSVDVNMAGIQMNMDVNVNDQSQSYSETTTTTTTVYQEQQTNYVLPAYDGPYGCPRPMSEIDFADAKRIIASKDFSDSKMTMAKQIIDVNCLLSKQVKELMSLFDYEDDKLEIAKYAYGSTLDYRNYYKVNNAFEYEMSIEELDEYIQGFRRN